ncbi:MAG: TrkH family potassium uptake protein [Rectinema subterraneum]|uniref:TrkH family potassium uptake protein n=1 Tax=Rectinema subterraneum TaxID=2653714 RepID=UPI003C79B830
MSIRLKIGKQKLLLFLYFGGIITVGSILLSFSHYSGSGRMHYIDALFMATSAVCVTGLSTIDMTLLSRMGQFFVVLLIQFGGLGIITFSTLYLLTPRRSISIITRGLASDYSIPSIEFRTRNIIAHIIAWTAVFELLGTLVVLPVLLEHGYTLFDAVFHSISAFCNAGLSTLRSGLESFRDNAVMNIMTMILIICGGLGFIVLQDIARNLSGKKQHLSYHSSVVLRTTAALILSGAFLIFLLESNNAFKGMGTGSKIMASFFQSVTARTAGFDTVPQADFSSASQFVTIMLMFIGASPASTGGGIKTTTFYLLILVALRFREGGGMLVDRNRTIMPHSIVKATAILVRAALIVLVTTTVILIAESARGNILRIETVVFESVSAFGTVGLSIGITPHLSTISKLALIAAMFMGRVGLFAMALPVSALSPEKYAKSPEADILLG